MQRIFFGGILERFTDFLIVLGVAFPPIAGIMVAEYFVVRQWRGVLDTTRERGTGLRRAQPKRSAPTR